MQPRTDVLCAGIIVADHVSSPISHLPAAGELVLADQLLLTMGGCAANVAVDLVKLGVSAGVVGRVGEDVFGRVVADVLRDQQVEVSSLQFTADQATSQTMIVNVVGEDRRFIHTFGANAVFRAQDIPLERIAQSRILYLGGYLLMGEMHPQALADVFAHAQQQGVRTVLDVVTPGPGDYLPRLQPVLPHVDVFLPNDYEGQLITGESDPLLQAERFHKMGARTAIVTLGSQGCVQVSSETGGGKQRFRVDPFQVPLVDATGGGDAFAAGYLAGMLQGLDARGCLALASAVGASCVQAVGTTTGVFTRAQAEEFLRHHHLRIEEV